MDRRIPQRIAERIASEYIHSGQVMPNQQLPSVRDLATVYGCSNSSITHALAILEQDGIVVRKHGQGCFVREAAVLPPVQSGDLIGLIGPSTDAELMIHVYDGVERVARQYNLHVIVASSNYEFETERWQVERMIQAGCRQIVLYPLPRTKVEFDRDYLNREFLTFPIVLVGNAFPQQKRSQVVFDNYRTGYRMTEHLLNLGHRRIAFMDNHGQPDFLMHYAIRERWRGFIDAMAAADAEVRSSDHWLIKPNSKLDSHWSGKHNSKPDSSVEQVRDLLIKWKDASERATAVVALEDQVAIQTAWAAHDLDIEVPGDLMVAGFDNRSIGRSYRPAFPTSNPDFRYAGEVAARLAIEESQTQRDLKQNVQRIYMIPAPILHREIPRRELGLEQGRHKPALV